MLTKKEAIALTKRLDKIANHVQGNFDQMGLSKKAAYDFCLYLDQTANGLEKAAGVGRSATTLQRAPDEEYMDSFNSPKGPVKIDPDEQYMNEYENDDDSQVVEDDQIAPMNDGDWEVDAGDEDDWYTEAGEDDWHLDL
jgi:hypothetical protein